MLGKQIGKQIVGKQITTLIRGREILKKMYLNTNNKNEKIIYLVKQLLIIIAYP